MTDRKCNFCNETKSLTMFYFCSIRKDGYRTKCKECFKKYRDETKGRKAETDRRYRENNKDLIREKKKEYCRKNANKIREKKRKWIADKRNKNIYFRLSSNVGCLVRGAIKKASSGNATKGGSTFKHLPYTPQQLKEHIENQFENWMTWDNWGEWHIDHIIPQSALSYDNLEHPNFQKCWALDNLRPLRAEDNIYKSNKY